MSIQPILKNKIVHIITGLNDGGAEAVLHRLCTHDNTRLHTVVSLMNDGKYGALLRAAGTPVHCLNMPQGGIRFGALPRLWRMLRKLHPHVVQTWMYHGNLVGGVVARLAGVKHVTWGIHHTTLEPGKSKLKTILIAQLCGQLSQWVPSRIICCAESSATIHADLGYARSKLVVVPNGYDLIRFQPDPEAGLLVRAELGVAHDTILVGMVGRFDPQKDHENLIRALSVVRAQGHEFQCLLVGRGLDHHNTALVGWITANGLTDRVLPVGPRTDIPAVMNALDVHVLSSAYGEAFPNVLSEAMACGTPCVTTDVGDAKMIVGDTGWAVPPHNSAALADGIAAAMESKLDAGAWQQRKNASRMRIQQHFSIEAMITGYHRVWDAALTASNNP